MTVAAIDIETDDPLLKTLGNGAIRGYGRILTVGIYCPDWDIDGWYSWEQLLDDEEAIALLADPDVSKVFHNGLYDLNWLVEWGELEVNGVIEDTMTREVLLDQYAFSYSLDDCCNRRGVKGKNKGDTIDIWWIQHGGKGKAIEHLKDIPIDVVGKYNIQDCHATYDLFWAQQPLLEQEGLLFVNSIECKQYPWLMKTRHSGFRIDIEARRKLSEKLNAELEQCQADFDSKYGKVNTRSYLEMEQLFKRLGIPVTYSDSGRASFTAELLEQLEHPIGQEILHLRMLEKALNTYIDGNFVDLAYKGKLYPELMPSKRDEGGAITGRYACKNPNLQAVSAREEKHGNEMRSLFIPVDDNHLLGAFDYKQIEYRVFIHFAMGQGADEARQQFWDAQKEGKTVDYHQMVQDMLGWTTGDKHVDKNNRHIVKCLSADSFIATTDGYVRAKHLVRGKHELVGHKKWEAFTEDREQLRITLSNGQQIECTPYHPFPDTGKTAEQLKAGDSFPLTPPTVFGDYVVERLRPNRRHKNPVMTVDEGCAYLLGLYLGDGCLHFTKTGPAFVSWCTSPEVTRHCWSIIDSPQTKFTKGRQTPKWEVWAYYNRCFTWWIYDNCGHTKTKHVPDVIYRSPKSVIKAFLAGFLDSDGTTNQNKIVFMNTNEQLLRGIARCVAMMGWGAGWSEERYNTKCYDRRYSGVLYRLTLYRDRPDNPVDIPTIKRHYNNSLVKDTFGKRHPHVVSIESIGIKPTFILEVDGDHIYQAECTRNHNCVNFGVLYGMGYRSLAAKFRPMWKKVHPEWGDEITSHCKTVIEEYYDGIPFVKPSCKMIEQVADRRGYVKTVSGRRQRKTPDGKVYKMVNYLIQGSAGDIIKKAIADSWDAGVWDVLVPHLMVHDELVFSIPKTREGYEACLKLKECMENAYKLQVPLGVDTEIGPNWGDCTEEHWKEFEAQWKS